MAPGERMGRVDLVARAVPVARVVPVSPVARVVPVEVTGRADLVSPEVRERVRTDPVARVSLVDLLAPVVLVVLVVRVSRVVPADPGGTDLVGPVVRRHLRTCSTVTTTGVARSGVVLATHRTASARRTMVRRHHHPHTDSVGTVDPLPERRHPTGTARRLRVAGTDRHPLGAGTSDGMGRRAT
nr:hypothetical protein [Mycobacterium sp. 1245111.1]